MLIIITLIFTVLGLCFSTIWIYSLNKRIQLLEAVAIEMFLLLKSSYKLTEENAAYINVDNKRIYLGLFLIKEDAARAYNIAAIKYHGEFAQLNIIS